MPKSPFKNGVTDLTRLTGQEYPGLCLITLVAMKGMLDQHHEKQFVSLLFMSLALNCWLTMDEYTTEGDFWVYFRLSLYFF